MGRYGELLRGPAGPFLATSGLARLGNGIEGLAFLIFFELETGSFAVAGLALGAFAVTSAAMAPARGRLVDLRGAPVLLGFTLSYTALNIVVLALGALGGAADATWVALSALIGVVTPPFSGWSRASLSQRLGGRELELAFSIDGVLEEVSFVVGPLIAGGMVALGSPEAAIALATALALIGGIALVAVPALRGWRPARRERRARREPRAPLNTALWIAVASLAGVGAAIGFTEVGITAFAERLGDTGAAGIVLAVLSAAGVLGALVLGTREPRRGVAARYVALLAWFAAGLALLPLAGSVLALAMLIAIPGLALTPIFVTNALLVGELSGGDPSAAAFSAVTTAINGGVGLGAAVAGSVVEGPGVDVAFLLAVASVVAGLVMALAGHRAERGIAGM